ncbi:MAG: M81 family metallopeptidase [Ferruginibacter sp.]|nr:M81 family metallopeptidase [Cytophagales bacterium]
MKKKIAIIELQQETNSFSPVPTTWQDFKSLALFYGEDLLTVGRTYKRQVDGFLKSVEKYGNGQIEPVPVIAAWATSGGPLRREVYDTFKREILEVVARHPDLAGIYLSMHGAMGVEGLRDPESDLLAALRTLVGDQLPIGVSFDLHANVTQEIVRLATFITAYRTNPHRDHAKTGFRTGKILIDTVLGRVKPVMAFRKMRLLKGGGFTIDFLAPMRGIFRRMRAMERQPGVLSVSNFMVHIWLDDPELGWSTIAVTDGNAELAGRLADELADLNWSVRDHPHPVPTTPEGAVEIARRSRWSRRLGTLVFCDVSDIVAAGAPGENTWILRTILQRIPHLVSYVPVKDEGAARRAFEAGVGDALDLEIGGKIDTVYNQSLSFRGTLLSKQDLKETGKTVVLRHRGVHLILTERPTPAFFPRFFHSLGLSLWKADVTVVKNLFPFRYFYLLYNRKTVNVISAGVTSIDVFGLQYRDIPRPIYPLDPIGSWR